MWRRARVNDVGVCLLKDTKEVTVNKTERKRLKQVIKNRREGLAKKKEYNCATK